MNIRKRIIEDLQLRGKRVIIRADYNVPLDDSLQITDDTRIRSTLPTINRAVDEGAKVILCSHLGRPKGKFDPKFSLAPVAKRLQRLLGKEVIFAPDCIGSAVEGLVAKMQPGDVMLLENLRFHPEEEKNDEGFSKALASLADVYINDAFGAAHRAHASTVGITKYIPEAAAGYLLKKEIEYLEGAVENPVRPFVAILGGAKVSGKIGVIEIGQSLVENDMLDFAKGVQDHAFASGVKFYLPVDCVVAAGREPGAETKIVPVQEIPKGWYGLDIGPASVKLFSEAVQDAKTILWNGPMGMFEVDAFARGTLAMAHSVANAYALTIVGGGETALAIHRAGESESISFISTGGGAALELLEGKTLPGLAALPSKIQCAHLWPF